MKIDVLRKITIDKRIFNSEEDFIKEIIKSTTGGPIRFRPLSREELEQKVKVLEKDKIFLQNKMYIIFK